MRKLDEEFFKHACETIVQEKADDKHLAEVKQLEIRKSWQDVVERAKTRKRLYLIRYVLSFTSVAAIAGIVIFCWQVDFSKSGHRLETNDFLTLLDAIDVDDYSNTSLVEDNKIIELEDKASIAYTDDGTTVTDAAIEEKEYASNKNVNLKKLITPRGKQASLTLSDGTTVKLNSGSKIICPAIFSGNIREVAIEGEAYFDVAHDSSRPFIVKTKSSELRVLGTSFCVRDYTEEEDSHIILLEGSVSVKPNKGTTTKLKVNEIMHINHNSKIKVESVNPEEYISWLNNILIIRDGQTLKAIITKLEKHYGISIDYDLTMADSPILGKIFLEEDVDVVLSNISKVIGTNISKIK